PSVGPNGRIYGYDTPAGLKIDPERVARDFAADFPEIDPPTHFDGFSINMNQPLGNRSATKPVFYQVSNLSVSNDLRIVGPVVIYVTGSIDVKNAKIIVEEGGSATFYVDGNV